MQKYLWKNWSLTVKLVLIITAILIVLAVGLTLQFTNTLQDAYRGEFERQAQVALDTLSVTAANPILTQDISTLQGYMDGLTRQSLLLTARVVNVQGQVLADAFDSNAALRLDTDSFGQQAVASDSIIYDWQTDRLTAGQAVVIGRQRLGAVVIAYSTQVINNKLALVQQQSLLVGLIAVLFGMTVAFLFIRTITVPLQKLTEATRDIATGDLSRSIPKLQGVEFSALANSFTSMTNQLRSIVTTLEDRVAARTEQLKSSASVGRAASSILDTDQLLREVVNLITDRFDFYYAAVFLVDDTGRYAVLREATGDAGRTLKQVGHKLEVGGQSMVGTATKTRRAQIALDVGKEAIRFANPLLPYTRSEIAVPLVAGDRILGALDVQSQQATAFDEASAEALQAMADQIAIALINSESFKRSEQQTRTLELLNQLSRELATATSLESIGRITASIATELVGPSRLFIARHSPDPELLSVQEYLPRQDQPIGSIQMMPRANTITGQAIQTGQTVNVPDMETLASQYVDANAYFSMGILSGAAIPMQVGKQFTGTFTIGSAQKNGLKAEQIRELEQVASQLAIALENRDLLQRTQAALDELDVVNRRLIGQAWERYTQTTSELNGQWRNGQWLKLPANSALPDGDLRLPIRVRGETIGEFSLTANTAWTADDITFAQSLIDQVGQTIETARLFDESERLARRERTINDINSRVRQTVKMDTILETAVNELARSLKAARVFARIGGHAHDLTTDINGEGEEHA
jgi:GAF domain-containing protein/HAMP domain-containing protein